MANEKFFQREIINLLEKLTFVESMGQIHIFSDALPKDMFEKR